MNLFDLKAYYLHQQRARKTFSNHAFLFNHVGNELISRLRDFKKKFTKALNISPHGLPYPSHQRISLEENLPFPDQSFDLILSCLLGHWINNLPDFLRNIHRCLEPEGLFLGALWGGQTLHELRESLLQAEVILTGGASPRVAPLLHPADAPLLLGKSGYFMPVVDTETIVVTYPSFNHLLKDLRGMGETNVLCDRPKTFTPRALFKKAEEIYMSTYGCPDRTLPATFEAIYLTGWKKPQA